MYLRRKERAGAKTYRIRYYNFIA